MTSRLFSNGLHQPPSSAFRALPHHTLISVPKGITRAVNVLPSAERLVHQVPCDAPSKVTAMRTGTWIVPVETAFTSGMPAARSYAVSPVRRIVAPLISTVPCEQGTFACHHCGVQLLSTSQTFLKNDGCPCACK